MARLKLAGTFGALCLVVLLAGCGQLAKQSELARSLTTWEALKAENSDDYRYKIGASSVFGPATTTTLTVQNGTVIVRTYEVSEINDAGEVSMIDSWREEGSAVGSHEEGAAPITIDARYSACQDDVLSQSHTTNDIYLEFQDNGVLASCFAIPKGAVYDGGAPIITDLEFLSP